MSYIAYRKCFRIDGKPNDKKYEIFPGGRNFPSNYKKSGKNWQEIRQNTCEEIHQKWLLWSVDKNPPTSAEPNVIIQEGSNS